MMTRERARFVLVGQHGWRVTWGDILQQTCIQGGEVFARMVKAVFTLLFLLLCGSSPLLYSQSRFEAGLLLDYMSISQTNTDNYGLGGRLGYRLMPNVVLEGELSYGYGVNFQELYHNIANGNTTALERTSIGVTDGLFGAMLEPAHGHLRPFVTLKAGFMDFRLSPSLLPYSNYASSILGIRTSNVDPVIYPGGGAEASLGPVGLRLEFGDAIYFNEGGHNNLRVTFGPIVRF